MYQKFFGLKERPFQLVPNPAYLFLSRSHEEAMAHLTYSISQGDGFVEITGEVGTGKTTLCRAFLEGLDDKTEAAYIFNPKLDSIQLLKTINEELGIESDADNTKDLIDILNAFLMEQKAAGKRVILVIDEAQNLSREVLEQLRLLSNLETSTSKLLQIILLGQPELGEMLDSYELRQLGQRITLSCNLSPLTYRETKEYIQHRIQIASQKSGIGFTGAAFRAVYKYSGGTPRLINMACDRALLTAFGVNRQKITGSIVRASIRELAGRGDVKRYSLQEGKKATVFFAVLCLALFIFILYRPVDLSINGILGTPETQKAEDPRGMKSEALPSSPAPKKAKPVEVAKENQFASKPAAGLEKPISLKNEESKPVEHAIQANQTLDLRTFLKETNTRISRRKALETAMGLWVGEVNINPYLDNIDDDHAFFRLSAKQNGILVHRVKGDFDIMKSLNLPAIMELYPPGGLSPRYLTVVKIESDRIIFGVGKEGEVIGAEQDEVKPLWSKVVYFPWKNFLDYQGVIPLNAPRDAIITLKMLMNDIGFKDLEITPFYDEKTRDAVIAFQKQKGLKPDGIVGPLTKIILYNEKRSLNIPHIIQTPLVSENR